MDFPDDFRVALDPGVRRIDGGAVLVGGSPLRLLRLTAAGTQVLDALCDGAPVPRIEADEEPPTPTLLVRFG